MWLVIVFFCWPVIGQKWKFLFRVRTRREGGGAITVPLGSSVGGLATVAPRLGETFPNCADTLPDIPNLPATL